MARFLGYANHIWKEHQSFTYTGVPQSFTLQPGTYLLTCGGALGGHTFDAETGNDTTRTTGIGGVSYGIIQLNESKTLQAYVGGDGENSYAATRTYGRGGWNGGGDGGISYHSTQNPINPTYPYDFGAGGGGASDIRLLSEDDVPVTFQPTLPDEYQQVEYLDTTNVTQYLNTGWTPTSTDVIETKFSFASDITTPQSVYGLTNASDQTLFQYVSASDWAQGSIVPSGDNTSSSRIRSKSNIYYVNDNHESITLFAAFKTEKRYKIAIATYRANKSMITNGDWFDPGTYIPLGSEVAYYRLCIRYDDETAIVPTAISCAYVFFDQAATIIPEQWVLNVKNETITTSDPLIPNMTSNSDQVGSVTCGGGYCYGVLGSIEPWRAFNDSTSTGAINIYTPHYLDYDVTNGWLQYEFRIPRSVATITATMCTTSRESKNVSLYVYDENETETLIEIKEIMPYSTHGLANYVFTVNQTVKRFKFVYGYSTIDGTFYNPDYYTCGVQAYATADIIQPMVQNIYGSGPASFINTGIPANTPAIYKMKKINTFVDDIQLDSGTEIGSIVDSPMGLFATRSNDSPAVYSNPFHGKLYFFRAISYKTNSQFANAQFECDPEYYFDPPVSCTISGRTYTSTGTSPIIAFVVHISSRYSTMQIISTDRNSVQYTSNAGPNGIVNASVEYKGMTFYWGGTGNALQGTFDDSSRNLQTYPETLEYSSSLNGITPSAVLQVLEALHVEPVTDVDTKKCELIPCYRKSDHAPGMYDTVSEQFITGEVSGVTFGIGPAGSYEIPTSIPPSKTIKSYQHEQSLLSRIIVAGGAGGGSKCAGNAAADYNRPDVCNYGGGIVGSPYILRNNTSKNLSQATQKTGYQFGLGESTVQAGVHDSIASSGGGGGWYGGYTSGSTEVIRSYSSSPGSGGSGYVLTNSSYKPEGYIPNSDFYMTNTLTLGNRAESAFVKIYKLDDAANLNHDDVIEFPQVGHSETIVLNPGIYTMKCWGADGGASYNVSDGGRGGYAQGTVLFQNIENLQISVGGSGIGDMMSQMLPSFPDMYYNGGGVSSDYALSTNAHGGGGGGASDVRVVTSLEPTEISDDSILPETLNTRLIVAGGGGGCGTIPGLVGGAGGGLTGGSPVGGSYGYTPGPGTQTSSPQSTSYPIINGGFGYGGNAGSKSNGYAGGAGGGGWYGGSGTYPSADKASEKGGCGGSGFVLSETSIGNTPEGYLLNEDYFMTDVTLTQGGNDLTRGLSKVEIVVDQISKVKFLCKDEQGVKRFDPELNRWVFLAGTVSVDLFETYGSYTFNTDAGLLANYDILIYDPDDAIESMDFDIVPPAQHIVCDDLTKIMIDRIVSDTDYDPSLYDVKFTVTREPRGAMTKVHTDLMINKKQITEKTPKVYSVSFFTK
jgi:hypothetical protein